MKKKKQNSYDLRLAVKVRKEYENNPDILLNHNEAWKEIGFEKNKSKKALHKLQKLISSKCKGKSLVDDLIEMRRKEDI